MGQNIQKKDGYCYGLQIPTLHSSHRYHRSERASGGILEGGEMSEFMDYLTRGYAYVAIGAFKPGKFPEAKALYEKAIACYSEGFKGSYLLQLPGTDQGIAIIFWDSMEAMQASETEVHQAIIKQLSPLFATHPNTNVYEVVHNALPAKS